MKGIGTKRPASDSTIAPIENAAHDVAEQTDDQREGARELLSDVERDHDPGRLGKGGEVAG